MIGYVLEEALLNEYLAESERTVATCDSYDVKAAVWLAIVTLLGTQTAYLAAQPLPVALKYGQLVSAILLAAAGIATLVELRPLDYRRYSPSNGAFEVLLEKLRSKHGEKAETVIAQEFAARRRAWLKEMIDKNKALNARKSRLILFAFWTMAGATGVNLLTLAITHLPVFQFR